MRPTIKDHGLLHDAVARATLAAGAAAVAGMFLPGSLAVGADGAGGRLRRGATDELGVGGDGDAWAVAVAAGTKLGGGTGHAIASVAIGGSLARGLRGSSWLWAALVGTVGAMTAALIGRAFALTEVLAALPNGVATLVAGATGGLVVGVSSVGRHLALMRAPLEHELRTMADDSELGRLLGRAASAYRDAIQAMGGAAPEARAAADELVGKMTRFGRRWRELEAEASGSLPEDLKERRLLVGRRLEASTIHWRAPSWRGRARRCRCSWPTSRRSPAGASERVARLEHQVATLERLRWAALRHRSADAARLGAELQPVVEELAQAGGDFDIASEALDRGDRRRRAAGGTVRN